MKNGHLEFPLVLDTNAPPSTISLIDNHPIEDYYSYLEHLSIWIESLGWAYVPLEYENDFALFVTAEGKSVLRDKVEEKLRAAGRTVFRLTPENGRFRWRGPIQFEG